MIELDMHGNLSKSQITVVRGLSVARLGSPGWTARGETASAHIACSPDSKVTLPCSPQFGLRLKEKVKQVGKSSNQPDKNGFIPTTYDRTQLTYEEAVKFADSLKIIRRRISESNHARTSETPVCSPNLKCHTCSTSTASQPQRVQMKTLGRKGGGGSCSSPASYMSVFSGPMVEIQPWHLRHTHTGFQQLARQRQFTPGVTSIHV